MEETVRRMPPPKAEGPTVAVDGTGLAPGAISTFLSTGCGIVESALAERRRHWTPQPPRHTNGILSLYARVARGSSEGASIT